MLGADGKYHLGDLDDPVPIDIDFIGEWIFEMTDQPFPPEVLALDGKKVSIIGFMLPDIDFEDIRVFHVVRSLWGCCFGAPPRINEIIRVEMPGAGVDYTYDAIEVVGTFQVIYEVIDGVVEDLYRMKGEVVEEVEFQDPGAPDDFDPVRDLQGVLPFSR